MGKFCHAANDNEVLSRGVFLSYQEESLNFVLFDITEDRSPTKKGELGPGGKRGDSIASGGKSRNQSPAHARGEVGVKILLLIV